ncbi:MAG: hypothetical protein CMM15_03940 [Rhodospirillaceae bacterium]|nr:hypothetical protein [Rhodospirillaceae bacterium]|tara:strand:- start:7290 stop:8087 length:798 start_codon:yes stop_codon:yes gene_type:complete
MRRQLQFEIGNASFNLRTTKKNKQVEKKGPVIQDVPFVTQDATFEYSDPVEEFCLTVSTTGTQATFKVEKTFECGASGFVSDCVTNPSYGNAYNPVKYDARSFAINCFTNLVSGEHTVETTSDDWQSLSLGRRVFVYYNKDGWFMDQWKTKETEVEVKRKYKTVSYQSSSSSLLSGEVSSLDTPTFPIYANTNDLTTFWYSDYKSFYMTYDQNYLSIFYGDGTVKSYKDPQVNLKIQIQGTTDKIKITGRVDNPYHNLTYEFTKI